MTSKIEFLIFVLLFASIIGGCGDNAPNGDEKIVKEESSFYNCEECPELKSGMDTLEFVDSVRVFLAKNLDAGQISNSFCDSFSEFTLENFPVARYLKVFEQDEGSARIGLVSRMMVKILNENGIEAYSYSFGFDDVQLLHHVVLFRANERLLITDPYLNYSPLGSNGAPLDIFTMIEMIGSRDLEVIIHSEPVQHEIIVDLTRMSSKEKKAKESVCKEQISNREILRDSILKVTVQRCFECDYNFCFSFIKQFESELLHRTNLTNFHQGYAIKSGLVWGGKDCLLIDDQIQTAIYSQPELGLRIKGKLE